MTRLRAIMLILASTACINSQAATVALGGMCYSPQAVAGVAAVCIGEVQHLTATGRVSKITWWGVYSLPEYRLLARAPTLAHAEELMRIITGILAEERAVRPELCSKPTPTPTP